MERQRASTPPIDVIEQFLKSDDDLIRNQKTKKRLGGKQVKKLIEEWEESRGMEAPLQVKNPGFRKFRLAQRSSQKFTLSRSELDVRIDAMRQLAKRLRETQGDNQTVRRMRIVDGQEEETISSVLADACRLGPSEACRVLAELAAALHPQDEIVAESMTETLNKAVSDVLSGVVVSAASAVDTIVEPVMAPRWEDSDDEEDGEDGEDEDQ